MAPLPIGVGGSDAQPWLNPLQKLGVEVPLGAVVRHTQGQHLFEVASSANLLGSATLKKLPVFWGRFAQARSGCFRGGLPYRRTDRVRTLAHALRVRLWLCVTSIAGPNGAAQLYER